MIKKYLLLIIFLVLISTGCGNSSGDITKEKYESNVQEKEKKILTIDTEYDKIDVFINLMLNELEMTEEDFPIHYLQGDRSYYLNNYDYGIVFDFWFNDDYKLSTAWLEYDYTSEISVKIIKKIINYSYFNFSSDSKEEIYSIIESSNKDGIKEFDNYFVDDLGDTIVITYIGRQ